MVLATALFAMYFVPSSSSTPFAVPFSTMMRFIRAFCLICPLFSKIIFSSALDTLCEPPAVKR
jgi:hypothetical protein